MSNNSNTALGLLAGAAIGTIFGILFAPDKGSVTRKRISEEASGAVDKIVDNATSLKHQVINNVTDKKATLDSKLENIVSDASYKADDVITTLEKKLKDLKEKNKKLQRS